MPEVAEIFELFQGRPATKVKDLYLPEGTKLQTTEFAQLGKLVKVGGFIDPKRKFSKGILFSKEEQGLLLCSSKGILYAYDPQGKLTDIKEVWFVNYYTDKYDEGNCEYTHDFKKPRPSLVVINGSHGKLAAFAGGRYKIKDVGITG